MAVLLLQEIWAKNADQLLVSVCRNDEWLGQENRKLTCFS